MKSINNISTGNDEESLRNFAPESHEAVKESYEILTNNKAELIAKRNKEHAEIDALTSDEDERFFGKAVIDSRLNYEERLRNINAQQARLRRYLRIINGTPIPKGAITSDLIQAAKEVPIETIFDQEFRRSGNKLQGLCPYHSEETGSFFLYRDTNRCHCFGCGFSANVIDSYIKLHNCSFNEAVLVLTGSMA